MTHDGTAPSGTVNKAVLTAAMDEETLARATLTYCLDGADAIMFATLKGTESAVDVLRLLKESLHGDCASTQDAASHALERVFLTGLARWGRRPDSRACTAFRTASARWRRRLSALPTHNHSDLIERFTARGSQWVIAPHSVCWPGQLADLSTRKDWAAPLCLWGRGDPAALTSCSQPVGVVGSRSINAYGRHVAHSTAYQAASKGHLVVSGGAFGADASAHRGALEALEQFGEQRTGRTVAVFAGGLSHIGPQRNEELFERIVASRGALISELCPHTIPEARRFLLRNRIIAALASTVIIAQARVRSGALNTANWAADLEREVYAAPGDIDTVMNAGCNRLIHENKAIILCSVESIDKICHQSHWPGMHSAQTPPQPSPHSSSAPHTLLPANPDPAGGDGTIKTAVSAEDAMPHDQRAVMRAIRSCRRRGEAATMDALTASMRRLAEDSPNDDAPATHDALMQTLGIMELTGIITISSGRVMPATGNG